MGFLDALKGVVGGAGAGSAFGPIGTAVGGVLGGISGAGSSSSSGNSQGSLPMAGGQGYPIPYQPINPYAEAGAQLALSNSPLTLATTRFGSDLGLQAGAIGTLGSLLGTQAASILADQLKKGQRTDTLQGDEIAALRTAGIDPYTKLNAARLQMELLAPNFQVNAANQALSQDATSINNLQTSNLAINAYNERALADMFKSYANNVFGLQNTRATTQGNLATGMQGLNSALQQGEQSALNNAFSQRGSTASQNAVNFGSAINQLATTRALLNANTQRDQAGITGNLVKQNQLTDSDILKGIQNFDFNLGQGVQNVEGALAKGLQQLESDLSKTKQGVEGDLTKGVQGFEFDVGKGLQSGELSLALARQALENRLADRKQETESTMAKETQKFENLLGAKVQDTNARLALGIQDFENRLGLGKQGLESALAQIRGQTAAQRELRDDSRSAAFGANSFFA